MTNTSTQTCILRDWNNNGTPLAVRVTRIVVGDSETWTERHILHGDHRALAHEDIIDQLASPARGADYGGSEYCRPARVVVSNARRTVLEQTGGRNI